MTDIGSRWWTIDTRLVVGGIRLPRPPYIDGRVLPTSRTLHALGAPVFRVGSRGDAWDGAVDRSTALVLAAAWRVLPALCPRGMQRRHFMAHLVKTALMHNKELMTLVALDSSSIAWDAEVLTIVDWFNERCARKELPWQTARTT